VTLAWLDASSGLSGDKLLAALLDIGEARGSFCLDDLRVAVESLGVGEAFIETERVKRGGISGLHVRVVAGPSPARTWSDIRQMLLDAALPGRTVERALVVFEAIALAESRVHGVAAEDVHFHEVGATDSIVDIVGVCLGLELLGIGSWTVGPIAVGGGHVETAHGRLPVPTPATLELLTDVPIEGGPPESGELTTPTGAALAVANADAFGSLPPAVPVAIGYGAGTREIEGLPNVLRVVLAESADDFSATVVLLETNLDHLPAEEIAFVTEQLLAEGALDVWLTPLVMKKGRPGVLLSVLTERMEDVRVTRAIHALTGSLGVRRSELERSVASREQRAVETPWGPARVKSGAGRVRPEHDDVARIASEQGLPYGFVRDEIARLASGA
jgi:hypothetical protein